MNKWTKDTPFQNPDSWDEETDVLVIGSGFAGLSAAIEAASTGQKVIIVEKMSYIGGNSVLAGGGMCAWDSKLKMREKLNLGEDSWQLHFEDTMKGGGYYSNPELVEIMVKEAPDAIDWLTDNGIVFRDTLKLLGGHSAYRSHQESVDSGKNMINALKVKAESENVEIRFETKVIGLWRSDASAEVSGVCVETKENSVRNIKANKAVIIATGGYGRDMELLKKSQPALSDEIGCNNHRGATGEVIRYAQAIGADTIDMCFIQLFPSGAAKTGGMDRFAFDSYSAPTWGGIYVNKEGKRFVNELSGRDEVSNAQLRYQTKPTWVIINKKMFVEMQTPEALIEKAIPAGRVFRADTIEELAGQIEIPADALSETINAHNNYVAEGKDEDFNKRIIETIKPFDDGPYYAIAQWPTMHYCMGGLTINGDAQVLDLWGNIIPNLLAAGEVTGGIHGSNRLAGNALTDCVVFGRRAGKKAAE